MRNTHNFKFHTKEKYKRADHAHLLSRRLILSVYSRGKKAKKIPIIIKPRGTEINAWANNPGLSNAKATTFSSC